MIPFLFLQIDLSQRDRKFAPASDGERRRGEGSKWRPSCLTRSITLSCLTRAIGLATERQTTDTSQAPPPGSSRESCRSRPRLPYRPGNCAHIGELPHPHVRSSCFSFLPHPCMDAVPCRLGREYSPSRHPHPDRRNILSWIETPFEY